jgi:multicomponent K+:H+ antiporter subunit C
MIAWCLAAAVGVLMACGVWLLLRGRTFDVVLGLALSSYAVNLFIFLMGRVRFNAAPILRANTAPTLANYADPLPQALALTAIVIGFAMAALVLALALKGRFMNDGDACDADPAGEPDPDVRDGP